MYDTETALYLDGPYRGAKGMNFLGMKIVMKPGANYFLAMNTPSSVAAWPFALPQIKPNDPQALVSFSAAFTGIEFDESQVLKILENAPEELEKRASALLGDEALRRWKQWHLTGDEDSNPFNPMKSSDIRRFLISQNTLASLQEVLYQYPMDKEVIKLYADKLEYLSGQKDIEEATRQRYGKSAKWYRTLVE